MVVSSFIFTLQRTMCFYKSLTHSFLDVPNKIPAKRPDSPITFGLHLFVSTTLLTIIFEADGMGTREYRVSQSPSVDG